MKIAIFFLYLLFTPSLMSASTEMEEYFKNEDYRNREINFFIKYIESYIPFFLESLGGNEEIEGTPCNKRDIILDNTYKNNPGNLLLEKLVYDWCQVYDALPYSDKYQVPVNILLVLEVNNSCLFRYDKEEQEWEFISSKDAQKIVSEMLSLTYNRTYNFYAAPAA